MKLQKDCCITVLFHSRKPLVLERIVQQHTSKPQAWLGWTMEWAIEPLIHAPALLKEFAKSLS